MVFLVKESLAKFYSERLQKYSRLYSYKDIDSLALPNEVSRIPLPSNLEKNGDYFGLKVQGDSMIEAGINEGDTVIIKRTDTAENGKIVVALIDEHEAMLKNKKENRKRNYFSQFRV